MKHAIGLVKILAMMALAFGNAAQARTYFIDYTSGNDASDGSSKSSPWKRHPYMTGFAGKYSHLAGDQFIFKGGTTWPRACFQMRIKEGGSSESIRDYYGSDPSWYSGSAWSRPVFDFEDTAISGSNENAAGVLVYARKYITLDAIEMKRHRKPLGNGTVNTWGVCTLNLFAADYITCTNLYIHDWSLPQPVGAGMDGGGGGGIYSTSDSGHGAGFIITHCFFDQANTVSKNGTCVYLGGLIEYNTAHDVQSFALTGGTIRYNHIYNMQFPSDVNAHANAIYTFAPSRIYGNRVHDFANDGCMAIYTAPAYAGAGTDLIYDNVVFNAGNNAPISITTEGASQPTAVNFSRIFNNTLEHGSGFCIKIGDKGYAPWGGLTVKNNHFITTGTPISYNDPVQKSAAVVTVQIANNIVQSGSTAGAQGYVRANLYAPTSSGDATVRTGLDLSSEGFNTDVNAVTRPSGAWDVGAYQFGSASSGGSSLVTPPVAAPAISAITSDASDADSTTAGVQVSEGQTVKLSATIQGSGDLQWNWSLSINGKTASSYQGGTGNQATVSYTYPAGSGGSSYSWQLHASNAGGGADASYSVSVVQKAASTVVSGLVLSASSATISSLFSLENGALVQHANTGLSDGGRAVFAFNVTQAGTYVVTGKVNAPSEGANSFFVNIDAEPQDPYSIWHIPPTNGLADRDVSWQGNGTADQPAFAPKTFSLSAGQHTLILIGRESGCALSQLSLSRLPNPPSNLRVVSN